MAILDDMAAFEQARRLRDDREYSRYKVIGQADAIANRIERITAQLNNVAPPREVWRQPTPLCVDIPHLGAAHAGYAAGVDLGDKSTTSYLSSLERKLEEKRRLDEERRRDEECRRREEKRREMRESMERLRTSATRTPYGLPLQDDDDAPCGGLLLKLR